MDKAQKAKTAKKVAGTKNKMKTNKAALKKGSKKSKSNVSAKDAAANTRLKNNKKSARQKPKKEHNASEQHKRIPRSAGNMLNSNFKSFALLAADRC